MTKIIVLLDWSDDQSQMPVKPGYTPEAQRIARRIMKSFKYWNDKQSRPCQLVLWHTHYPGQWIEPKNSTDGLMPVDCGGDDFFYHQTEAIAKNYNPKEAIIVTDNTVEFTDDLDLNTQLEAVNQPNSIAAALMPNSCFLAPDEHIKIMGPPAQRFWGTEQAKGMFESPEDNIEEILPVIFAAISNPDAVPKIDQYEKDWTEMDFLDWVGRTAWRLTETSPHESTALGCGAELPDLYKAAMFILRNGSVQMAGDVPLMTYPVNHRRYWLEMSYGSIGRTAAGIDEILLGVKFPAHS